MFISDIAGKNDLFLDAFLRHPDLDGGRAQKMARVHKTNPYIFVYMILFSIRQTHQTLDSPFGIIHII